MEAYFPLVKKRMRPSDKLEQAWLFKQPLEKPELGAVSAACEVIAGSDSDPDDDVPLGEVFGQWELLQVGFHADGGTGDKADDLWLQLWLVEGKEEWTITKERDFLDANPDCVGLVDRCDLWL